MYWADRVRAQRVRAQRVRGQAVLSLAVVGTVLASVTLVAAVPARAVETYARPADSTVRISGHGYGHGHGMSQWGAYGAAAVRKLSWQRILAFYYPGTRVANLGNRNIRVRLDAVGSGILYVPNTAGLRLAGRALPRPTAGITQYRVRPLSRAGWVRVEKRTSAGWRLYTQRRSPAVFSNPSRGVVDVRMPGGTRRAYRGHIYAHRASATRLATVNVLPMESYLRAVVPAEMPASWHPHAVRAQAVAARSYANYDRAHTPAGSRHDTCDTTSCQMYLGVPAEKPASSAAVAATAGRTLTYLGKSAFTQFSASNGGWTTAGSRPYLRAKADPYDGAIPNGANAWTASITAARIQARWPSIGRYRQLRVIKRDGHGRWRGRILNAVIYGSKGKVAVTGATFRFAFGLKSEWFIPTGARRVATYPRSSPSYPRDFSGDKKADVLAVVAGTGALRMYVGNGASGWTSRRVIGKGFGGFTKVFTAGTWNTGGLADVLAQRRDGTLWLYPGAARGWLGSGRRVGSGWGIYNTVFPVGDFSGDGRSDLMARRPDGRLVLYPGNGGGGFLGRRTIGTGWNRFNLLLSPGDFDGDGKSDVIARTSGGLLYLYPGNGAGGWLRPRLIGRGWDTFSTITSPGDFTGDRRSDLLGHGRDGRLWLYPGDGSGRFLPRKVVGSGWNVFSTILR